MPTLPCPETPAVTAAARDGSLTRNPRLAAHVQVCGHCLARVFGDFRQTRGEGSISPSAPSSGEREG